MMMGGKREGTKRYIPEVYALDFTTDEEGYLLEKEWGVSCGKGEEEG